MTEAVQTGTEWVPRFGMLEVSRERAELIRGLFELAAWVADHPELPLPDVHAAIYPRRGRWDDERALVDRVAAGLGSVPEDRPAVGFYEVERLMGSVRVYCTAINPETRAATRALMSYADSVQPDDVAADLSGGAR
jgi:hypothetical protein